MGEKKLSKIMLSCIAVGRYIKIIYWRIFSGEVMYYSMYNNYRQTFFLLSNTDDQKRKKERDSVFLRWRKIYTHTHTCTHKDLFYES